MPSPFLTVLLTVISGTLVYTLGQLFAKLLLEPSMDLRSVIGKVHLAIGTYVNLDASGDLDRRVQAVQDLPVLAVDLEAKASRIVWYPLARRLLALPERDMVHWAACILILHRGDAVAPRTTTLMEASKLLERYLGIKAAVPIPAVSASRRRAWLRR